MLNVDGSLCLKIVKLNLFTEKKLLVRLKIKSGFNSFDKNIISLARIRPYCQCASYVNIFMQAVEETLRTVFPVFPAISDKTYIRAVQN